MNPLVSDSDFYDTDSMFANTFSFLGRPLTRQTRRADIYVVGIPFDLATSGRAGSRHGPMAIRQASANLRWEEKRWPWEFSIRDRLKVADYGDLEFDVGNPAAMTGMVEQHVGRLLDAGCRVLSLGGDHFVTLPLLRTHHRRHGTLSLIHFDAHTDTYEDPDGNYDHGCMFYHAPREGLIDPARSVQIGIRTEYTRSGHPFRVLDAAAVNEAGSDEVIASIREAVGQHPVYLTFDIDCLDPAFAPGTGTPVIGGLTSERILSILRGLAGLNIVGMDVVEVAPAYDHADVTSLAAATIALELLYVLASEVE